MTKFGAGAIAIRHFVCENLRPFLRHPTSIEAGILALGPVVPI